MSTAIPKEMKLLEKYEFKWDISNWPEVQTSKELIESQKIIIETGLSKVKARWIFGLKADIRYKVKCASLTIKLDKLQGTDESLSAHVNAQVHKIHWSFENYGERSNDYKLGDIIELRSETLPIYDDITKPSSVTFLIKLEIAFKEYPVISLDPPIPKPKPDFGNLAQNVSSCMRTLMNDEESSDITIVTVDGEVIHAHRIILKAQCPALYTFVQSILLGSPPGTVTLSEISAKTLKIFLHLWYTGILSEECFDENNIVEFTNFAGKFKMTPILEMLDSSLGAIETTIKHIHVQLLDLVQTLDLTNAKTNLLERIIKTINQIETGMELLEIFPQDEKMVSAHFESTNLLQIMNEIVVQKGSTRKDVLLLAAVGKQGLSNLEALFLGNIVKAANKIQSPDELFDLFGFTKQSTCEKEADLLVRKLSNALE